MPVRRVVRSPRADDDLVEIAAHLWLEDVALAERFLVGGLVDSTTVRRLPKASNS
jgi:hypothetical protein